MKYANVPREMCLGWSTNQITLPTSLHKETSSEEGPPGTDLLTVPLYKYDQILCIAPLAASGLTNLYVERTHNSPSDGQHGLHQSEGEGRMNLRKPHEDGVKDHCETTLASSRSRGTVGGPYPVSSLLEHRESGGIV